MHRFSFLQKITFGTASIQLAFPVIPGQVDPCNEELKTVGVPVLEPSSEREWGRTQIFFKDPEHNILEIYADI